MISRNLVRVGRFEAERDLSKGPRCRGLDSGEKSLRIVSRRLRCERSRRVNWRVRFPCSAGKPRGRTLEIPLAPYWFDSSKRSTS